MKKMFFIAIALFSITLLQAQSDDEAQIRLTLSDYINGTSYNKTEQIKKAFAKNATLYLTDREGEFKLFTPEEYSDFFKNREPGEFNGRTGKILGIEMDKDIATARVEIMIAATGARYIDLFLLKKIDGKAWKIISKTATLTDPTAYVERDKKLDNFTLQRLIVLNNAGEVLMEQYESGWFPPAMYSNERQSINEALDSLALTRGIKTTESGLRAYVTYKYTYHELVSFRSYFVAKYTEGSLLKPKDALAIKWMPIEEALPKIPVEAIRLTTQQILEFPDSLWGGSFLISENGALHETEVLEGFYPLFDAKL